MKESSRSKAITKIKKISSSFAKDQSYRLTNIIKIIPAVMLFFRDINQYSKEKLMTLNDERNDYVSNFLQFSKEIEDSFS